MTERDKDFVNATNQIDRLSKKLSKKFEIEVSGFVSYESSTSDKMIKKFLVDQTALTSENGKEFHTIMKARGFTHESRHGNSLYSVVNPGNRLYKMLKGLI